MKKSLMGIVMAAGCLAGNAQAQGVSPALLQEAKASVSKGVAWLKTQQKPSGAWSDEGMPALTALPLWAMAASGEKAFAPETAKAVDFLLSKQQPDGGIYIPVPNRKGGGLGNYNTSIGVMGLQASGKIQEARIDHLQSGFALEIRDQGRLGGCGGIVFCSSLRIRQMFSFSHLATRFSHSVRL